MALVLCLVWGPLVPARWKPTNFVDLAFGNFLAPWEHLLAEGKVFGTSLREGIILTLFKHYRVTHKLAKNEA